MARGDGGLGMTTDDTLRRRQEASGTPSSPSRPRGNPQKKGGHSGPTARRGTPAFEELMEEMLEEWELEEDLADNIVELRRYEDTFEYRLKGHSTWELLEDDDEDGADEDDGEEE